MPDNENNGWFSIDKEKIDEIASKFEINKDSVELLNRRYDDIRELMSEQHLAHVMRSLETYIRKNEGWELFRITCNAANTNTGIAGANYQERIYFNIVYDENLNSIQKRVSIAHELGHLFVMILKLEKDQKIIKDLHEPLSSIFGIFTMLEKAKFYSSSKSSSKYHKSFKSVVCDFLQLKNRNSGKYNISC